ncbi:MAG: DUF3097 family protein [Microthrixaceae bacterium]
MRDILEEFDTGRARPSRSYPALAAELDLVVLHRPTGTRGRISRFTGEAVELLDARGARHSFRNRAGAFAHEGETVNLVRPAVRSGGGGTRVSASGALVAAQQRAKVAMASRLWVEGDHDARLLERVWGDELREMAVVVEPMGGLDGLPGAVEDFAPGPGRSLVVLVDHLVEGTKEQRIAEAVATQHVLVVGHPYVDIWQCVRARSLGIASWPEVPRGEDWKTGICERLGWGSPREGWRRVLAAVDGLADLDAALIGAVETALDHFAAESGMLGEPGAHP